MNKKVKMKKGVTLVEAVLAMTILMIVLIPISNTVISSVKTNKSSERRQEASYSGQKILEEFKSYNKVNLQNYTVDGSNVEGFQLLNSNVMKQDDSDKGLFTSDFKLSSRGTDFDVDVQMKKNDELSYPKSKDNPPLYINLVDNNNIEIHKKDGQDLQKIAFKDSKMTINVKKSGTNYKVELLDSSNKIIYTAEGLENLTNENIVIYTNKEFSNSLNIEAANYTSDVVTIDSYLQPGENLKYNGIVNTTTVKGSLFIRSNKLGMDGEPLGDMYNINVKVDYKGETLFSSSVAQNIQIA